MTEQNITTNPTLDNFDKCQGFAIVAVGFGSGKDLSQTWIIDPEPSKVEPPNIFINVGSELKGETVIFNIETKNSDNTKVLISSKKEYKLEQTGELHLNFPFAPKESGEYNVHTALMTDDGVCYDEKVTRIKVIRSKVKINSVAFAQGRFSPNRTTIFNFPENRLDILFSINIEKTFFNTDLRFKFDLYSTSSSESKFSVQWQQQFRHAKDIARQAYEVIPESLAKLEPGYYDIACKIETLDASEQFELKKRISIEDKKIERLVDSRLPEDSNVKGAELFDLTKRDTSYQLPITLREPPQRPSFGCVAIDATSDRDENGPGAMDLLRVLYPSGSNHQSTQECVEDILACAGNSKPSVAISGHGNIGYFCTGGGNSGSHTNDQIVAHYNRPHWLPYFRKLRGRISSLVIISCEAAACNEGASLLSQLANVLNCPVTSATALVFVLNNGTGYQIDDGGRWLTAIPNATPSPHNGPAVICPSSLFNETSAIREISMVILKIETGYQIIPVEMLLSAQLVLAGNNLAARRYEGDELILNLLGIIDFDKPLEINGVPVGVKTADLSITFSLPEGGIETRDFSVIADSLLWDKKFPTTFYRIRRGIKNELQLELSDQL